MTDLEKRVATLEQELDVIKHQVQTTLLDIQEQVLTNTYPLLRSNDGERNSGSIPKQAAPTIQSVSVNGAGEKAPTEARQKPSIIRMVNVNEPPAPKAPEPVPQKASEKPDPVLQFSRYEEWVGQKVDQLGIDRTRKLIKLYTKQGHMTIPTAKRLLSYVALYADEEEAKPRKAGQKHVASAQSGKKSDEKSLIVRLIAGLSSSNSSGARKHG